MPENLYTYLSIKVTLFKQLSLIETKKKDIKD